MHHFSLHSHLILQNFLSLWDLHYKKTQQNPQTKANDNSSKTWYPSLKPLNEIVFLILSYRQWVHWVDLFSSGCRRMWKVWDLGTERVLLEVCYAILHSPAFGRGVFNYLVLQTCHCGYIGSILALICILQPRGARSRGLGNSGKLYCRYSIFYEARDRFTVFQPLWRQNLWAEHCGNK